MKTIKRHAMGLAILSAKLSTMAVLLIGGSVFGVWAVIQALSFIV